MEEFVPIKINSEKNKKDKILPASLQKTMKNRDIWQNKLHKMNIKDRTSRIAKIKKIEMEIKKIKKYNIRKVKT